MDPIGRSPELVVLSREPFNAETPLELQAGIITPIERHYVRSHFAIPSFTGPLVIDGLVRHEIALSLEELRAMLAGSLVVTLECAGNGRAFLDPPAPGEPWRLGAVGTAEWTGVPLVAVMARAGVRPAARELLFTGADHGSVDGRDTQYERSLPIEYASGGEALLAYAMNGEDLTPHHGAPLRLIVPGWYGVASVKWLARITAIPAPFGGFYQAERYVIDGAPLREVEPRALITWPTDGAALEGGPVQVRGYAWSGRSPLMRVEVSANAGATWVAAALGPEVSPHAWRTWQLDWKADAPGDHILLARAIDARGAQPERARWNRLGYANNACRPLKVRVP